jgi:hypothetical protein
LADATTAAALLLASACATSTPHQPLNASSVASGGSADVQLAEDRRSEWLAAMEAFGRGKREIKRTADNGGDAHHATALP